MKRTCLWAITSHDIVSCCLWNLKRYDNVVSFPKQLALESFPNPLAFESEAENLSNENVPLISSHTFIGSIQTIKTCFCSARISRDIDWPCNCASQKATDNTWGVRSENHTSVFPVLQVRIMSTCTQWHIGWAWSRVGEGQTPPSDDEACWRSNRDQDTFGKNIDGNIWSCGKKSSRTLRHFLENEICNRLTYPRDVSNFCKNAEDSENMRIKHVLRFSRDLWSTVIANQNERKSTWRPGPSRRPSILSTIWS